MFTFKVKKKWRSKSIVMAPKNQSAASEMRKKKVQIVRRAVRYLDVSICLFVREKMVGETDLVSSVAL